MKKRLCDLPVAITEPIGTTGAEIVITHVGSDSDGLPRARIAIRRGELLLATDVVRLDRDADRRGLIRAVLKEEKTRRAKVSAENNAEAIIGDGLGESSALCVEGTSAPLSAFEIERALLRAGKSVRVVGMPPDGERSKVHQASGQAPDGDIGATAAQTETARPEIVIRNDLSELADEAERLLLASPSGGIYKRSRMLVRVVHVETPKVDGIARPAGAPVIEVMSLACLRDLLARSARWRVIRDGVLCLALPPKWLPETLLARGDWPFARLDGVIEIPTLRSDGTILETPGYDPATGLLYQPSAEFPPVPSSPTRDEVMAAIAEVSEPFSEFPFVAQSDKAAALATVLTLAGRTAIDGPTPLFAVRATTPGTGKGLLVFVVSWIGSGRGPTLFAVSRDDEEVRKRLLTIGLEGTRCILLDNVDGALGSSALAAALTAREITDRLLGSNRSATVRLEAVWLATGNNITFRGDLGRRVLLIDLDAKVEFPEDRTFQRKELSRWVQQEHPRLVTAALTLLRAFHVAGRPGHHRSPFGSFEAWDSLIRAAVLWLGFDDPCAGRRRVREESDADLDALGAILGAWWSAFGSEPQTLARAIEAAFSLKGNEDLATALAGLDVKSDGRRPNARPVGDRLRRWKGRIAGGLVLETDEKKEHGATLWRVVRVGQSDGTTMGESGSQGSHFPPLAV